MRTKEPLRQVGPRTVRALSVRKFQFLQMNPWKVCLFLAMICLFCGFSMVLVAQRRSVGEVDRKFLDEVVRQQSEDRQNLSNSRQNIGTVNEIPLSHPEVRRAELVVNSAIVKRGELVLHAGIVKQSRSSITTSRQNSQAAAESSRPLN
jgi:hypothetical protein